MTKQLILLSMLSAIILGAGKLDSLAQKFKASVTEEALIQSSIRKYFKVLNEPGVSSEESSSQIASGLRPLLEGLKGLDTADFWYPLLTRESVLEMEDQYKGLDNVQLESLITRHVEQSFPSLDSLRSMDEETRVAEFLKAIGPIRKRMVQLLRIGSVSKFVEIATSDEEGVLVFHKISAATLQAIFDQFAAFRNEFNQEIKEHFEEIKSQLTAAEEGVFSGHFNDLKNLLTLVLNPSFVMKNLIDTLLHNADKNKNTDPSIVVGKTDFVMRLFALSCVAAQQPSAYNGIRLKIMSFTKSLLRGQTKVDARTAEIHRGIVASYFSNLSDNAVTQSNAARVAKEMLTIMLQWRMNNFDNLDKVARRYASQVVDQKVEFDGEGSQLVSILTDAIYLVSGDVDFIAKQEATRRILSNFERFYSISERTVAVMTKTKVFLLNTFSDEAIVSEYESTKLHLILRLAVLNDSLSFDIDADPFFAMYQFINAIVTGKVEVGSRLTEGVKKSYPFLFIQALACRKHKLIKGEADDSAELAEDDREIQLHDVYPKGPNDPNWKSFLVLHDSVCRADPNTALYFSYLAGQFEAEDEEEELTDEQVPGVLLKMIQSEMEMNVNSAWVYSMHEEEAETEKLASFEDDKAKLKGVKIGKEGEVFNNDFAELQQDEDEEEDSFDDQSDHDDNSLEDNEDEGAHKEDILQPAIRPDSPLNDDDEDELSHHRIKEKDDEFDIDSDSNHDVHEEPNEEEKKVGDNGSPKKDVVVQPVLENGEPEVREEKHEDEIVVQTDEEPEDEEKNEGNIIVNQGDDSVVKIEKEKEEGPIQITLPEPVVEYHEPEDKEITKYEEVFIPEPELEEEEEEPKTEQHETSQHGPSVQEIIGSNDAEITMGQPEEQIILPEPKLITQDETVDEDNESKEEEEEIKPKEDNTPEDKPSVQEIIGNNEENSVIVKPEDKEPIQITLPEPVVEYHEPEDKEITKYEEVFIPGPELEEEEEEPKTKQHETSQHGPSVQEIIGSNDAEITMGQPEEQIILPEPKVITQDETVDEDNESKEEEEEIKPEQHNTPEDKPSVQEIIGNNEENSVIVKPEDKEPIQIILPEPVVEYHEPEVKEMTKYEEVVIPEPESEEEEEEPKTKQHETSQHGPSVQEIIGSNDAEITMGQPEEQIILPEPKLITQDEYENQQPKEEKKVTIDHIPSVADEIRHPKVDVEEERVNLNDEVPTPLVHKSPNKLTFETEEQPEVHKPEEKQPCTPSDKHHVVEHYKGEKDARTEELIRNIESAQNLNDYIEELKIEVDPVTGDEIHYHLIHVVPHDSDCYEALMKTKNA